MKLHFDKSTFRWGYAYIYTVLQIFLAAGFCFVVVGIVLNNTLHVTVSVPNALTPIVAIYIIASLVGFPLVTVMKIGQKRLVRESYVVCEENKILYHRLVDSLWTIIGHIQEKHDYEILRITSVSKTRRFYVIAGDIKKTVINNGVEVEKSNISKIKIPSAFADMERIIGYGKHRE